MKTAYIAVSSTARNFSNSARRGLRRAALPLLTAGLTVASTVGAKAENEGVSEIVTALNGLKPDLGTVVTAAIGIALISIGAVAAISLGKRIMGK